MIQWSHRLTKGSHPWFPLLSQAARRRCRDQDRVSSHESFVVPSIASKQLLRYEYPVFLVGAHPVRDDVVKTLDNYNAIQKLFSPNILFRRDTRINFISLERGRSPNISYPFHLRPLPIALLRKVRVRPRISSTAFGEMHLCTKKCAICGAAIPARSIILFCGRSSVRPIQEFELPLHCVLSGNLYDVISDRFEFSRSNKQEKRGSNKRLGNVLVGRKQK